MPSIFCCWTCANRVITLAIPLITILIGVRSNGIDKTEFSVPIKTEIPETKIYPSAYSTCDNDRICLRYWDIIEKCHPKYPSLEIIKKCQDFVERDFINDTALFAPITSTVRNITYLNVYCGICNFERKLFEFEFWTPWLFFKNNKNESSNATAYYISNEFTRPVDGTEVLDKLRVDDGNDSKLISEFNETIYQCNVIRVLPKHLQIHVEHRRDYQNNQLFYSTEVTRVSFSRVLNQNYSNPDGKKFCSIENSSMESFCDYRDENGDTCSLNMFLSDFDSTCGEDGYTVWTSSEDGDILAQCSKRTTKENHFYACGPSKPNLYKKIKNRVFNVLRHVSAFFLFSYLALSTSEKTLRNLPKRIFYSYSVTLFVFYIYEFPLRFVESCAIRYYVYFYIWHSHSFWILITAFDLWRLVYNSMKIQKVSVEGQTVRYFVYCTLGWGLPAVILAALFFTLTPDQKLWSCPSVFGFENELVCSSSCDLNEYTFNFVWVTIVIFLAATPLLLILTCVLICLNTRNTARSNVNRTYTVVLFKVSIMMGIHWMLLAYLTLFDSKRLNLIYEFISAFQGCFIFFAFGLDKNNLNRFKRVVSRSVAEQTECTDVHPKHSR